MCALIKVVILYKQNKQKRIKNLLKPIIFLQYFFARIIYIRVDIRHVMGGAVVNACCPKPQYVSRHKTASDLDTYLDIGYSCPALATELQSTINNRLY